MSKFTKIWLSSLLFKLILSAIMPLSSDEAYYWVWSKHLQLSYLDHPPFVAWLLWFGHFFEPYLNAVRWPAVILGHLTLLIWTYIWRPYFAEKDISAWLFLYFLIPMTGLGSLVVTPDLPLLFFWSSSTLLFMRLLKTPTVLNYFLLGASLGLGFCSKYHIVLFVLFSLIYLFAEKKYSQIKWPYIFITFLSGILFSLPVLIWNYENDFASFRYQMSHGFHEDHWRWQWPISYVVGQVLLLLPTVIYFALKSWPKKELRLLHYLGWGPFIFFFLSSLKGDVELNWPLVGFPAIITLAVFGQISKKAIVVTSGFWVVLYLIIVVNTLHPFFKMPNDKLAEAKFSNEQIDLSKRYAPLYTSNYQMASLLWYLKKVPIYKLYHSCRMDFFDGFPESKPQGNKFYLLKESHHELPDWIIDEGWVATEVERFDNNYVVMELTK